MRNWMLGKVRNTDGMKLSEEYRAVNRKQKGFTLVELIVVLVIVAILAAILVPTFIGFIDKGKDKQVELDAQKALTATQTALSDIYADAGNRYSPAKREATRMLADMDTKDNNGDTQFTVWTEERLHDGYTAAIQDNVGAYTISKALYREGSRYAAYDGKEWTIHDSEEKAKDVLDIANANNTYKDLTSNVIYVWPWAQDYAYIPGFDPDDPDDPTAAGDGETIVKVVTIRLPEETLGNVFFSQDGYTNNSGKDSVKVVFWGERKAGDAEYTYTCEGWDDSGSYVRFKVDDTHSYWINTIDSVDKTYSVDGWSWLNDDGTEGTELSLRDFSKNIIQDYIFAQEDRNSFTLLAKVSDVPIEFKVATIKSEYFRNLIKAGGSGGSFKIVRTQSGPAGLYTEEMVQDIAGAVRVDMNRDKKATGYEDEDGVVYAWNDGDTVKWWTDATTVYLPPSCESLFRKDQINNRLLTEFDFSDFDVSRVTSMYFMFLGQSSLSKVTIGPNFRADVLTNAQSMFDGCKNLSEIDMEHFNADSGTLTNASYMFLNCGNLKTVDLTGMNTTGVTRFECMFDMKDVTSQLTSVNVSNLRTDSAKNLSRMFYKCAQIKDLNTSSWDLQNVEDMSNTFWGMKELTDLHIGNSWNLQNCKNMQSTFDACEKLQNQNFSAIVTTDKLENLYATFHNCKTLTYIDLSNMNVKNVENMQDAFWGCEKVKTLTLSGWKPEKVKTLHRTFRDCQALEYLDLSGWDLRHVGETIGSTKGTMYYTFYGDKSLRTLEIGNGWNLQMCEDFESAFNGCSVLTGQDFGQMQVASPKNLNSTFRGCESIIELDLRHWDLRSAVTLQMMFYQDANLEYIRMEENHWRLDNCTSLLMTFQGCGKLNQDFREISTSDKLTNIRDTFNGLSAVRKMDLRGFNTESVTECAGTFSGCTNLVTIYATVNFRIPTQYHSTSMFKDCRNLVGGNGTRYSNMGGTQNNARYAWLDGNDRSEDDGGIDGYFTEKTTTRLRKITQSWLYESFDKKTRKTYTKFERNTNLDREQVEAKTGVKNFAAEGEAFPVYIWNEGSAFYWWSEADSVIVDSETTQMFMGWEIIQTLDLSSFDFSEVKDMSEFFQDDKALVSLDLSDFRTDSATNMENMFRNCSTITELNLKSFDTSKVEKMDYMFAGCTAATTIDVSRLDTGSVTSFTHMFENCKKVTALDVSGFDTSNVTSMTYLFKGCENVKALDVSGFDTSKVTDMSYMFDRCMLVSEYDLSNFDTGEVTTMQNMFGNSDGGQNLVLQSLDISSFTTDKLMNIKDMFIRQRALEVIYVTPASWPDEKVNTFVKKDTAASGPGGNTFKGCKVLKSEYGLTIPSGDVENNADKTSGLYARVDDPSATQRGYFTDIASKPGE